MCVLVQIETREAMKNLPQILDVEGVDGVFIGPADLSADMGYAGNPQHPEVQAAIEQAIVQIREAGKAPGILIANEQLAKRYLELGALFVAVGVDSTLLARAAEALAARFGAQATTVNPACINAGCAALIRPTLTHQTVGRIRRLRRIRQKPYQIADRIRAFVRIRHKPCRTLQKSH